METPSKAVPAGAEAPTIVKSVGARSMVAKCEVRLAVPAFVCRISETRPPDDERRADAAFVEHALAAAKWARGSGTDFGAVIGADKNQGVVAECRIGTDALE